ncbi:MAG: hypothetical protein ACRENA_15930 [Vulcanimicrobiaceae bacterium]
MITAAEPPSHPARAFAGSLALHGSLLALAALLVPAWNVVSQGNPLRESAPCSGPCAIVTVRLAPRTAAAAYSEPRVSSRRAPQPSHSGRNFASAPAAEVVVTTGVPLGNPTALAINPPSKIIAVPFVAPATTLAIEHIDLIHHAVASTGNWGWGSRFDSPTLRDRTLYAELIEKLPKGGSVTVVVDDRGHATDVRIVAPGLDAATIADLREKLLAARYAPVERDGIAFSGSLLIRR